jgi:FtsZ-binding cell division protein ZapB
MNDTTTMQTDLDRLADRVERAAALVQQMREDRERLGRENETLTRRVAELEQKLQGQDPAALLDELNALKREQRDWQTERRDVASRIETLVKKLERIET